MAGTAIIAVTVLLVFAAVFVIVRSFQICKSLHETLSDPDVGLGRKILLSVPYLVLTIWCFIVDLILTLILVAAAVDVANKTRNWWHRGR